MHGHSVLCSGRGTTLYRVHGRGTTLHVLCSGQGTILCRVHGRGTTLYRVVIDPPQVLNLSADVLSAVESAEQAQNSSAACLAALGHHYRLQGDLHKDVSLLKRANRTLTVSAHILASAL